MEAGQIIQSGSYEELLVAGTTFDHLVNAHKTSIGSFEASSGPNQPEELGLTDKPSNKDEKEGEIVKKARIQLTEEEEMGVGDVGWKTFWDYISISKGLPYACLSTAAQCCFVCFQAAASFWLALSVQNPETNRIFIIGIYTLISFLSAVFVYLRPLFAVKLGLKASEAFFSGFTNSIFNAPMLFFDSTPIGRILTRVRYDVIIMIHYTLLVQSGCACF